MVNLWSVLAQTLALSVAAAVLLAAKRLFLDKLSPRWQYGVWAILALRALLPAGLLGRTLVPGGRAVLEAARLQVELPLSSALTDPYGVTEVLAPVPLFPRGLPAPGSITDALFYLYAAGVLLLALWFFLSYARLRAAIRRGLSPAPEVLAQVEGVAARYGLKAPRLVAVLPGLESAFVCGPLRPVLALPDRPVDDKVLLHELLHLRHGDVWAGVGVCALRCLHWCNPLIWYCCDRMQNDCEALCDQRVLERLEGEERRAYGVILLSMADGRYARAPGTSSMANGGRNIKARIQAIARFRRYPAGMALASGCVAAVLALTCLGGVSGAAEVPGGDRPGRSCPGPGPAQPPHHRGRSPGHLHAPRPFCATARSTSPWCCRSLCLPGTSVADRTGPLPGGGAGGLPFLDSGVPLAPPRLAGGVVGNEPPA